MKGEIRHGECISVMGQMTDGSADAVVTDPPYGIQYRGAGFDRFSNRNEYLNWTKSWGAQALRCLKPGRFLLAFCMPRTYHLVAVALEDVGLEIRDQILWLHGQGFPKGPGQLKPAHELVLVGRKPGGEARQLRTERGLIQVANEHPRKPSTVTIDEAVADELDPMAGRRISGSRRAGSRTSLGYGGAKGDGGPAIEGSQGGASRFFFVSKERRSSRGHINEKPLDLMAQLVRLVAEPGEVVLDPFVGNATTAIAAEMCGCRWIGIDNDLETVQRARERLQREIDPTTPTLFEDQYFSTLE